MIGSITEPVGINQIVTVPPNLTSSDYYFYEAGYQSRDTIMPARGYWIKVKSAGSMILSTAGVTGIGTFSAGKLPVDELNTISISDAAGGNNTLYFSAKTGTIAEELDRYEMPPLPPSGGFDARFASGRYVDEIPRSGGSLMVRIQSESYPVNIRWATATGSGYEIRITDPEGFETEQSPSATGEGWVRILDPRVSAIQIKLVPAKDVPHDFTLMQNYPNPFNPSTLIEFGLPTASVVTIKIYNILGEEVATIINNETLEAGIHKRSFDTNNGISSGQLSSGMYFYRINARSDNRTFSDIKKMMLIK